MLWIGRIYNEFHCKDGIRWHDYVSIMIHNFPIILVRHYDFNVHSEKVNTRKLIIVFGFSM